MKKIVFIFILVGFFSLSLITTFTSINGEYLQTSINSTINKINELEPFYVATAIDCNNSKQFKSHPNIIFQDTCVEKAKIKGIGKNVKSFKIDDIFQHVMRQDDIFHRYRLDGGIVLHGESLLSES